MLTSRKPKPRRDESGAIAVMYALLLTAVLIPTAALGVDLGNAVARRTHTQSQADLGAYASAYALTGSEVAGATPAAAIVTEVAASLNANQPQDDNRACWTTGTCITASMLTDGNLTNGEIRHLSGGRTQVIAPNNYVDFALAGSLGFNGTEVGASATVKVKSVGLRVLPMFAVDGCDYGRQTLTDPAGPTPVIIPLLASPAATNHTELAANSLIAYDSAGTTVPNLTLNSANNAITLTGRRWKDSTKIGFFREGTTLPTLIEQDVFTVPPAATNVSPYTENNTRTIRLQVPDSVAAVEAVWYVRVWSDISNLIGANAWSSVSEALPLRVGAPLLECAAGSVEGNFGTLNFPRINPSNVADNLPVNIADGLELPLTPTRHVQANASGLCADGVNGAVESYEPNVLRGGTNCVDTDTGLTANVATQGLISGASGYPGLLTREDTYANCSPTNNGNERAIDLGPGPDFEINDDILSCYLRPDQIKSLAEISSETYAGGAAFIPELINSPRFIQVPVLGVEPNSGGSNRYSIIDYRPGFITDELVLPATIRGTHTASSDNGITISNNGITTIKVVFFNRDALPNGDDVPLMDFLGVGPPIPVLVEVS